jgi:hypothetical protein
MLRLNKSVLVLILVSGLTATKTESFRTQNVKPSEKVQPQVLEAVAPSLFIPFALNETGIAEVFIEVKIDSEGKVISAKTISYSLFKDLSLEETAKKWLFEKGIEKERTAHIKFVLRIMPEKTDLSELSAIYRYPTEIEIRHVVFKGSSNEDPEFDKEIPVQKKPKP